MDLNYYVRLGIKKQAAYTTSFEKALFQVIIMFLDDLDKLMKLRDKKSITIFFSNERFAEVNFIEKVHMCFIRYKVYSANRGVNCRSLFEIYAPIIFWNLNFNTMFRF